jgi:TctA family transporter
MGKRVMTGLAILAIVIGALQKTSIAFLSPDSADFVWGLAAGLTIGTIVAWVVSPRGE